MSLLNELPHVCNIYRRISKGDGMGGTMYEVALERAGVPCWEQQASATTVTMFEKRGVRISTTIYFTDKIQLTAKHRILIVSRFGEPEPNLDANDPANPNLFDVQSETYPDASAGLGVLWSVACSTTSGEVE